MSHPDVAAEALEPEPLEAYFGAAVACLFTYSLLVGLEYILWLVFAIAVFAMSYGTTPAATNAHGSVESVAHLGLPLDVYVECPENDCDAPAPVAVEDDDDDDDDDDDAGEGGARDGGEPPKATPPRKAKRIPRVYVSVSAQRSFERYTVEGYAHWRLPTKTGRFVERLVTWKPVGRIRDRLQDFFLGGAHRLADMRYAAHPPDAWHANWDRRGVETSFLSKFGFMAERSGAVDVVCNVTEVLRPRSARAPTPAELKDERLRNRSAAARSRLGKLDNILAEYRKKLKLGSDYSAEDFSRNKDRSAADRARELIGKLEGERKGARTTRSAGPRRPRAASGGDGDAEATANPLAAGAADAPLLARQAAGVGAEGGMLGSDSDASVENPDGDVIIDVTKPLDRQVTSGTVTRKKGQDTVVDFSRAYDTAGDPGDLLTGDADDDDGVEESKHDATAPAGASADL